MGQSLESSTLPSVADYIVVVSDVDDYHANFINFGEKVNRKLKAGYQLHGQPFAAKESICQAMVRYADPPKTS